MLEWNQTVRNVMADNQRHRHGASRGGRVIAIAGAKGGVGTTMSPRTWPGTWCASDPNIRVCLVDLDVENGDVPSYLDVSHRVSIADLAKISEDLTARAVSDTVVAHCSRLHLLLTPPEIRDTEFVTPEAVRRILAQLRDALPPGGGGRRLGDHHHPGGRRRVGRHDAAAGHRRRAGPACRAAPDRGLGVARRGRPDKA